jgi:hypothetical protein
MEWKDYLTDQERDRLAAIEAGKREGQREKLRIYDRCRKRMAKETINVG